MSLCHQRSRLKGGGERRRSTVSSSSRTLNLGKRRSVEHIPFVSVKPVPASTSLTVPLSLVGGSRSVTSICTPMKSLAMVPVEAPGCGTQRVGKSRCCPLRNPDGEVASKREGVAESTWSVDNLLDHARFRPDFVSRGTRKRCGFLGSWFAEAQDAACSGGSFGS